MRSVPIAGWGVASAVLAFPLAMLALAQGIPVAAPGLAPQSWFSASFAIALLAALLVMPRAGGFGQGVLGVLLWVAAGHALWVTWLFLRGAAAALDRETLIYTMGAQATLGLLGFAATRLWSADRRLAASAVAGAVLLAAAAAFPGAPLEAAAFLARWLSLPLFALVGAASFEPAARCFGMNFRDPAHCAANVVRWAVALHLVWLAGLLLLRRIDTLPPYLPLATGALQIAATFAVLHRNGRLLLRDFLYERDLFEAGAMQGRMRRGRAAGGRVAWILSYTGVSHEPRVIRQAAALLNEGWRVVVCGFEGHSPRPPEWNYLRLPDRPPFRPALSAALTRLAAAGLRLCRLAPAGPLRLMAALVGQRYESLRLHTRRTLLREARANRDLAPALVLAHDHPTCDAAWALARRFGAKFAVDCHEYAVAQHSYDPAWAKTAPFVAAVQDHYLRRADLVTTVSEGIAELLDRDHALRRPALAVRSLPRMRRQRFRPTGERITVLYHGIFAPTRGLLTAIESLPLWRPEFDLLLRGGPNEAYAAQLRQTAHRLGVAHRVRLAPPASFDEIVPRANEADIGYSCFSIAANASPQFEFALPNKFFEYVMAGLALCVLDMAEMRRLVRQYGLGLLIPDCSPAAIAQTVNSFTRESIDGFKKAALAAAEELNWEREQVKFAAAIREIAAAPAGGDPR